MQTAISCVFWHTQQCHVHLDTTAILCAFRQSVIYIFKQKQQFCVCLDSVSNNVNLNTNSKFSFYWIVNTALNHNKSMPKRNVLCWWDLNKLHSSVLIQVKSFIGMSCAQTHRHTEGHTHTHTQGAHTHTHTGGTHTHRGHTQTHAHTHTQGAHTHTHTHTRSWATRCTNPHQQTYTPLHDIPSVIPTLPTPTTIQHSGSSHRHCFWGWPGQSGQQLHLAWQSCSPPRPLGGGDIQATHTNTVSEGDLVSQDGRLT